MPLSPKAKNAFFAALQAHNPQPATELQYGNDYQLLVAVVLSAQSTDVGVNKATKKLFARIATPAQMLKLGEEKLRDYIRTIGLYHTKAKNIIALSTILQQQHQSTIPRTREALQALPGVGPANVAQYLFWQKKFWQFRRSKLSLSSHAHWRRTGQLWHCGFWARQVRRPCRISQ